MHARIFLDDMSNTIIYLSQYIRVDSNPAPPDYKSRALPILRPASSAVQVWNIIHKMVKNPTTGLVAFGVLVG
jgi:hypothetical protein